MIDKTKQSLESSQPKKPWEMIREEYNESVKYRNPADIESLPVDTKEMLDLQRRARHSAIDEYIEYLKKKPNGTILARNVNITPLTQLHLPLVEFAVAEDKPVPANVLIEYPWLKLK